MVAMPTYIGKGKQFWLVTCELMPSPNASKEEKIRVHQEVCVNCGFFRDALRRQQKAMKQGKQWRKLVCVHPKNKAVLEKWKPHVTVWGV